jgi:hypothetical protein
MKKTICITALMLGCVGVIFAGGLDKVVAKITGVSLTSTKSTATTSAIKGWLERIDLTFSSTTSSADIVVSASNSMTGIERTLLTIGGISNSISYAPRYVPADNTGTNLFTDVANRFVMLDEVIYLTATNATYSNQNLTATIIYERP